MRIKPVHALQWVADLLEGHPTFAQKKMFGGEILSLHERQMLFLIAKEEPWNGVLVCTSREHHSSLMQDYPALKPHPVLGKWLYISQAESDFERLVEELAARALRADERLGVLSKPRRRKTTREQRQAHRLN